MDTAKFFEDVEESLNNNGVEAALELCDNTEGPLAQIFSAGLSRIDRGLEEAEKAISNAASLEMSICGKKYDLAKCCNYYSLMLGFTGTVAGMVNAFDAIAAANDISPAVVAGGISQALLTTAFGLIVAMIIQIFQNFFVSMIDKLILEMEEYSAKILDRFTNQNKSNKIL